MNYDVNAKIATVYFKKACTFTILLDDSKIGIGELQEDKHTLSAFPNPAGDQITFSVEELLPENCRLEIFDMMGKKVKKRLSGSGRNNSLCRWATSERACTLTRIADSKGNTTANIKIIISR